MDSIQPYEFLGVTFKTPLKDVRRRYYDRALMCHPDKGGAAQDMMMLHCAYKWIERQLAMVDGKEQDYEAAKKSFEDFVESQKNVEVMPSMTEVSLEASGYSVADITLWFDEHAPNTLPQREEARRWFVQMILRDVYLASFDTKEVTFDDLCSSALNALQNDFGALLPAAIPAGYGDAMLHHNTQGDPPSLGRKELVVYHEQTPFMRMEMGAPFSPPNALDDYSVTTPNALHGSDYKQAYADDYNDSICFEDATKKITRDFDDPFPNVLERLEEVEAERAMMDMRMADRTCMVQLENLHQE
jgi:curved DNA-binding protein CbpA